MEILYAFSFDGGFVFEIKNTLLPNTAPKNERCQWILIKDQVKTILQFDSMTQTTRVFNDGIVLDLLQSTMILENQIYNLKDIKGNDNYILELQKFIS